SRAPQSARRARPAGGLSTEEAIINRIAAAPSAGKGPKGGSGAAGPKQQLSWPLNRPGRDIDFSPYLGRGRKTLVYFYADWCPACRATSPGMKAINLIYDDFEVIALDIEQWGSPVAARHGVNFVPYLQIYDEGGELFAEGNPAGQWITDEVRRRNAPK
ncbi:MAG TPA: thioredoxin family protein, partial [Pyrinomonadaceae bacterium]